MRFALSFGIGIAIVVLGRHDLLDDMGFGGRYLFGITLELLYYVPMELVFGRTIGKFVTGTEVVNEKGERPTAGQIIGRTFARFIPFEPFSFFGNEPRGWHDTLSGTYVVKRR